MNMTDRHLIDGKKILIVDDEKDILDLLEEFLPTCRIWKASSFDEAKSLLDSEVFDLAILDIMGVDGYSLLEIVSKKGITAVMLTAHALTPEDVKKSYRGGAAYYIPKEELSQITTLLEDVLEAREKGKNSWGRWFERLGAYFDKKFGPQWEDDEREIWRNIKY